MKTTITVYTIKDAKFTGELIDGYDYGINMVWKGEKICIPFTSIHYFFTKLI